MFCGNCGKQIEDNSVICPYCGNNSNSESIPQQNTSINQYSKIFISPDEQYIASLGNNYINSFLSSKAIKQCNALLSDKRIYLQGTMIEANGGKVGKYNVEKVINLEDITGTGFIYAQEQLWKFILALITIPLIFFANNYNANWLDIPLIALAICLVVSYLINRNTMFFIEYAGGSIRFDASIYGIAESQDFHKQIRRMQDKRKEK